jgi:hypothetical protein
MARMDIGQVVKARLLELGVCMGRRPCASGKPLRLVALWLVSLLLLPNCSFLFTKPVSTGANGSSLSTPCTTSRAPPTIDVVMATLNILGAVFIAGGQDKNKTILLSGSLLWTGVYMGSAIYGFRSSKACESGRGDVGEDMGDPETPPDPDIVTKPMRQTGPVPDPGLTHRN